MPPTAILAQAFVRSRNGGRYHLKHNNCQHFIIDLLARITTIPLEKVDHPVMPLRSSSASSCGTERGHVLIRDSFEILERQVSFVAKREGGKDADGVVVVREVALDETVDF